MGTSEICALVFGALLLIAVIVCWRLNKDYLKYSNLVKPILNALLGVLKAVNGVIGDNETINIIITVISTAIEAAGKAEEYWLSGDLDKQARPVYANQYIKATLNSAGIEVTDSIQSIIDGAIALTCYLMPHEKDKKA